MTSHALYLITLCIFASTTAELSKLSEQLISEGLISLDESGVPTTFCAASDKYESRRIDKCRMTDGFGPRSVGCFVVWNGTEVLKQGCYSSQEISLRSQCKRQVCSATSHQKGISFCCCHGAMCNA